MDKYKLQWLAYFDLTPESGVDKKTDRIGV